MTWSRRAVRGPFFCLLLLPAPSYAQTPAEGPVRRWLEEHCREVTEVQSRERGGSGTCTWEDLSVTGHYPDLTISFTQVETLRRQGSKTVRLSCTATECRAVDAAPPAGAEAAGKAGGEVPEAAAAGESAASPEDGAPRVVEEARAALRRAEDRREEARRVGADGVARGRWSRGTALLAEARQAMDADPRAAAEKARAARQEFVAARRHAEELALEAASEAARQAGVRAREAGADRDPATALEFADAERDLSVAATTKDDPVAALARVERAARKFERVRKAASAGGRDSRLPTFEETRARVESWLRSQCGSEPGCAVDVRGLSGVPSDLTVHYVRTRSRAAGAPVASVEGLVRLDCQAARCVPR